LQVWGNFAAPHEPVDLPLAPQRHHGGWRGSNAMKGVKTKGLGLAIVGAGRVGLFRGEVAARHPAAEWIGIARRKPDRAHQAECVMRPGERPGVSGTMAESAPRFGEAGAPTR
jgi:hypothetical protein